MSNAQGNSPRDKVFHDKREEVSPFAFDENVANVFDDMISRSVPFYDEIHRIILDLVGRVYKGGTIYDLGCSTGTTIKIIADYLTKNQRELPNFIGIDNSAPMIQKAQRKFDDSPGLKSSVNLLQQNIEQTQIDQAGLVIMNYTLQFLSKDLRKSVLQNIYKNLKPGGIFILSEKIVSAEESMNELLIDLYYDFKRRNGYSELEISQKREALENVLIPITPEEQIEILKEVGFKKVDMVFRWYNFASYLGVKQ